MVNLWDYVNAKKVKILDLDGNTFIDSLVCIMDEEENAQEEDDISIQIDKKRLLDFLKTK